MNLDEISDDDEMRRNMERLQGMVKHVPNLTKLPLEERQSLIEKAAHHCMEMMMKTYVSTGMGGNFSLGALDGNSGTRYEMDFRVIDKDDPKY